MVISRDINIIIIQDVAPKNARGQGTGNKYIIRHGLRVICVYDYATYELHTLHRHPGSGHSQQYGCHMGSQLVWTQI